MNKKTKLMEAYSNLDSNLAFSGAVVPLSKKTGDALPHVLKEMRGLRSWTLHRQVRHKFPTRKYKTMGLNDQWQIDLVEMQKVSKFNNGYRYMLSCIDVFSRYARVEPVKNKTGQVVAKAMNNLLLKEKPNIIQSDQGKEFYNIHFKDLLKKYNIKHISVKSQFKSALVERFNKTLKSRLY